MKITLLPFLTLMTISYSCRQHSITNTKNDAVYKNVKHSYVVGGDGFEKLLEMQEKHGLIQKEDDPDVSWTYFADLYKPDFNASQTEYLGFTILETKKLASNLQSEADKQTAKLWVERLVATGYSGYEVLYKTLAALQSYDSCWVAMQAKQIEEYAGKVHTAIAIDKTAKSAKTDNISDRTWSQYQRVSKNYGFVSKISELSNSMN